MNKNISLIIGLLLITGCTQTMIKQETNKTTTNNYIDVTPNQAHDLIEQGAVIIIDVSPNYDQGHIPGAINFYVGDGSLDKAIPTLDPNREYLVYCHVESASKLGAQKLLDAGFTTVYRLDGDYPAWKEAGFDIEI